MKRGLPDVESTGVRLLGNEMGRDYCVEELRRDEIHQWDEALGLGARPRD